MLEKICTLLSEQLDIDIDRISADTDIMSDLGADSLDLVEFLNTLEDELGISIPQDSVKDVKTVGDLAEVINSLQD